MSRHTYIDYDPDLPPANHAPGTFNVGDLIRGRASQWNDDDTTLVPSVDEAGNQVVLVVRSRNRDGAWYRGTVIEIRTVRKNSRRVRPTPRA